MACETPVVASAVGGIPEVVTADTGLLVALDAIGPTEVEPRDPAQFSRDLAAAVNVLLDNPERRAAMGRAARARVEETFSWHSIARKTLDFYEEVRSRHRSARGSRITAQS
jgi:glycosyltransferase involved in cell wall biosynthesis